MGSESKSPASDHRLTVSVVGAGRLGSALAAALGATGHRVAGPLARGEAAASAGMGPGEARALLAPLVRSTVENWAELGPERALTGPVARGDDATVAAQRAAVDDAAPHLLPLFDALVERTRELASRQVSA